MLYIYMKNKQITHFIICSTIPMSVFYLVNWSSLFSQEMIAVFHWSLQTNIRVQIEYIAPLTNTLIWSEFAQTSDQFKTPTRLLQGKMHQYKFVTIRINATNLYQCAHWSSLMSPHNVIAGKHDHIKSSLKDKTT